MPSSGSTDIIRKQLDELMGKDRDGAMVESITDFRDPRVCRDYLLGLCPHALLQNTKEDLGFCPNIHDDKLRAAYQAEVAKGASLGYERGHERTLENFVSNAERKILRSKRRADDGTAIPSIDVDRAPELSEISRQIDDMNREATDAGDRGDVDKALGLQNELEALRRRKAEMQAKLVRSQPGVADAGAAGGGVPGNRQRLRVCDICGAFLSLNDSDERLADHFGGRVHLGFLAVRQKLAQLRAQLARAGVAAPPPSSGTSANSIPVAAPPAAGHGGDGAPAAAASAAGGAAADGSAPADSGSSRGGGYGGYGDRSDYRDSRRDDRDGGGYRGDSRRDDSYRGGGGGGYGGRRDDSYRDRGDYRSDRDYRGGGGGRDDYRRRDDDYRRSDDRRRSRSRE